MNVWFSAEQVKRLETAFELVRKTKNDRAGMGSLIKELIGFPIESDLKPLVDERIRKIITEGIENDLAVHRSHRPAS